MEVDEPLDQPPQPQQPFRPQPQPVQPQPLQPSPNRPNPLGVQYFAHYEEANELALNRNQVAGATIPVPVTILSSTTYTSWSSNYSVFIRI